MEKRDQRSVSNPRNIASPVWGVRIDSKLKQACRFLAAALGISASTMVSFILSQWFAENRPVLETEEGRDKLERQVRRYSRQPRSRSPVVEDEQTIGEPSKTGLRALWTVRGLDAETITRIHVLALNRKVPMYRLMDDIVAAEWEKVAGQRANSGVPKNLRKKAAAILRQSLHQGSGRLPQTPRRSGRT